MHIHQTPIDVIEANAECDDCFIKYGNINEYVKVMQEYNIKKAFIMPFNDPYRLSMDFTVESVNYNLSKMVEGKEDLFGFFADIDLRRNIEDTISELDRVKHKKGFSGIKIHPSNTGYPVDGAYYSEIFKYAFDHNILVEIHSYPRTHLPDDVCSPSRIKRIAALYPGIRLSIAHLGGFQYKELAGIDAYYNISAILTDLVDAKGITETNKILRTLGTDRLIFATDYPDNRKLEPEDIYNTYFEILNQMDFSQEEATDICWNNALRMLQEIIED